MKILTDHTDQTTAYMVNDYPYGFRMRTKIRYWVESKNKYGQRLCSQTLNPKTNNWNKPKKGVYNQIVIMGIDTTNNHVTLKALNYNDGVDQITLFEKTYQTILTVFQVESLKRIKALNKAWDHITVTVGKNTNNEQTQTRKEQSNIVNKAFSYEYSKLK